MNTNLKILLALALVVFGVFGITVISNYTQTEEQVKPPVVAPADGGPAEEMGEAVRYSTTQIFYNPDSENKTLREFPGYFEVNDQEHAATYWIQNVNPVPVDVTAISRSCSACTNVRLAVFPARPALPGAAELSLALLGGAGSLTREPAELEHRLKTYPVADWKLLDFDQPGKTQSIPAGSEAAPTWVAVQLNFKVRQLGQKELGATLGFRTEGQKTPMTAVFRMMFVGVPKFEVRPGSIDFQEMGENTPSKIEEIIYVSATIPQKDFSPPTCLTDRDPFLEFSKPIPLTDVELAMLVAKLSRPNSAARVSAGYRFSVTLHRKNPDPKKGGQAELDIGPLDKGFTVFASAGGSDSENQRINVKANVTGLVALANGGSLDLGTFRSREGTGKGFSLRSDRLDLELEVVSDKTEPKVLQVSLDTPKNDDGRRFWILNVKIAPGATTGELSGDSAVVLRDKKTGQMIRLMIKGRALL